MAQAPRDENFVPTLLGVSNADGTTPVPIYADPVTHRLLVDLPGGSGSVTSVSVVSANGFAGTVATATSTPAITLTTTITGMLKGNGTAISAATAGDVDSILPTQTGNNGKYLTTNGTVSSWATIAGGGDVVGPASSVDNAIVRFNGLTGKIIQDYTSGAPTISDTGVITATQGGSLTGTWTDLGSVTTIDINGGSIDGVTIGAAAAGAITGTTVTANTGFMPDANDGAYLGQSGTAFSDLFLASGGVINWDAGNMVLTHSAGVLTISNSNTNETGPILELYQDSSSPAANDDIAEIQFFGKDSAGNKQEYARIEATITDPTSTTEAGKLTLWVTSAGSITSKLDVTNAALTPTTNDGIALGAAATSFSDLFLASGAVLNFANGNSVITHSSGILDVTTGDLRVTTAGTNAASVVTVGGAQTLTNKTLTSAVLGTGVSGTALADASGVNTGTSTTTLVTPDSLSGSYAGTKSLSVQVFDGATDVATGDGKAYITIPGSLNGMNLIRAQATVVTAGTTNATTVMIHNKTDAQDMLSGAISIASGGTVGTVGTINTTYDDVATNDVLRIDVDSVSTTAPKGLMVVLEFRLP